jgi:hypothetical protein
MVYGANKVTDGYKVEINFRFVETNEYGDELDTGSLHYTRKLSVKTLAELANVLSNIENIDGTNL